MNIGLINTYDFSGGAAIACYRLHKSFLINGNNSKIICLNRKKSEKNILEFKETNLFLNLLKNIENKPIQYYINNNRTKISNTVFNYPYPGYNINKLVSDHNLDIINLHWINNFLSPYSIRSLIDLGKPIVWTFHDEWPMTGGCHYTCGCENFKTDCKNCPQISVDNFNIPKNILNDKIKLFENNITIVTPSLWLSQKARTSSVFKNSRIETIPNSVDTDIFKPLSKSKSRKQLNLNQNQFIILFGVDDSNEIRKGFELLISAIKLLAKEQKWVNALKKNQISIIKFGSSNDKINEIDIPIKLLGKIDSEEEMSIIYSSADIFILPSIEDNLPNTMLESMACGTPIVGFDTGGIPDAVINDVSGYLSRKGDIQSLSMNILKAYLDQNALKKMGIISRDIICEKFNMRKQAESYIELFNSIKNKTKDPIREKYIINKIHFENLTIQAYFLYAKHIILTKLRLFKKYFKNLL